MEMNEMIYLFVGGVMMAVADWVMQRYMRSQERNEILDAEKLLKSSGLEARLYLPTLGIDKNEDVKLIRAMDLCASSGKIILNRDNNIVGGIIPSVLVRKPELRLVVSNDSPENE